ncbi:hypothetical protein FGLOB1_14054 [Fusarium globosum]|uniref:F-box domain-containing protein n=1 Tax=Fusarium globosum TaxID=78864 RepID=A0A8H5XKQ5_9HYPO|nr:hypothetical protein FGLOB1_14054 [Fusarium globosum]
MATSDGGYPHLLRLSTEMHVMIVGYLDTTSIRALSQTCRRFRINFYAQGSPGIRFDGRAVDIIKAVRSMAEMLPPRNMTSMLKVHVKDIRSLAVILRAPDPSRMMRNAIDEPKPCQEDTATKIPFMVTGLMKNFRNVSKLELDLENLSSVQSDNMCRFIRDMQPALRKVHSLRIAASAQVISELLNCLNPNILKAVQLNEWSPSEHYDALRFMPNNSIEDSVVRRRRPITINKLCLYTDTTTETIGLSMPASEGATLRLINLDFPDLECLVLLEEKACYDAWYGVWQSPSQIIPQIGRQTLRNA